MARLITSRDGICYPQECTSYHCFCGPSGFAYSGGDEGLTTAAMDFAVSETLTATASWDAYNVQRDLFQVIGSSGLLFDSGCVINAGSATFSIPAGNTTIQLFVIPNCAGGSGTLWDFGLSFECPS